MSDALDVLTEDKAAQPDPVAHRHHPMTFGVLVGGLPLHVVEHAAQIRQFSAQPAPVYARCPAIGATCPGPERSASLGPQVNAARPTPCIDLED